IKKIIQNQPEIHAIIFVLKSNQSKLTPEFELAMRSLLSIFPKSAVQNIFFFYTFSVGTFFAIGDVMGPLVEFSKKFKATQSLAIPVGADRGFCIDSESFRYLLAKNQKIQYSTRKEKDFAYSWDKSAESIAEFTNALKDLPPIQGKEIVFAENLVKTALNFCDWYEANGANLPAEEKAEFDANLADLLKSVLNKTMPLEMPRIKRVLAVLNCGSILMDNSAILERIKTLLKIQKKLEN
uniref:Uncharacterized protein n=1 Tax=Panagrolaimus sp. JU765 TaxID=591449 RepID=A0AC34R5C7_9BILA